MRKRRDSHNKTGVHDLQASVGVIVPENLPCTFDFSLILVVVMICPCEQILPPKLLLRTGGKHSFN